MTTIFKYKLQVEDHQMILMPQGAKILDAQIQDDELCIWAMVDSELPTEPREIRIFSTGRSAVFGMDYIGTVQMGVFVWHVFEQTRIQP